MPDQFPLSDSDAFHNVTRAYAPDLGALHSFTEAQTQLVTSFSALGELAAGASAGLLTSLGNLAQGPAIPDVSDVFATVRFDEIERIQASLAGAVSASLQYTLPDLEAIFAGAMQPLNDQLTQLGESVSLHVSTSVTEMLKSIDATITPSMRDLSSIVSGMASSIQLPDPPLIDFSGLFTCLSSIQESLQVTTRDYVHAWGIEAPYVAATTTVDTAAESIRPAWDTSTASKLAQALDGLARWADEHPHQSEIEACAGLLVVLTALWVWLGHTIFGQGAFYIALELARLLYHRPGQDKGDFQA